MLLAIKFVLIDYIILKTKEKPILLLDDVLSELDEIHQNRLIENLPKQVQTMITTTDFNDVFRNKDIKKFKIIASQIIQEEDFDGKY